MQHNRFTVSTFGIKSGKDLNYFEKKRKTWRDGTCTMDKGYMIGDSAAEKGGLEYLCVREFFLSKTCAVYTPFSLKC